MLLRRLFMVLYDTVYQSAFKIGINSLLPSTSAQTEAPHMQGPIARSSLPRTFICEITKMWRHFLCHTSGRLKEFSSSAQGPLENGHETSLCRRHRHVLRHYSLWTLFWTRMKTNVRATERENSSRKFQSPHWNRSGTDGLMYHLETILKWFCKSSGIISPINVSDWIAKEMKLFASWQSHVSRVKHLDCTFIVSRGSFSGTNFPSTP